MAAAAGSGIWAQRNGSNIVCVSYQRSIGLMGESGLSGIAAKASMAQNKASVAAKKANVGEKAAQKISKYKAAAKIAAGIIA